MKLFIAILVLAIALISGCTQISSTVSNLQTSQKNYTCPYEDIIKNDIHEVVYYSSKMGTAINVNLNIPTTTTLQSGDKVETTSERLYMECNSGSAKGQNVNYLYCGSNPLISKVYMGNYDYFLKQTVISPDGIVKEIDTYTMLEPIIIDTTTNFTILELKCEKTS